MVHERPCAAFRRHGQPVGATAGPGAIAGAPPDAPAAWSPRHRCRLPLPPPLSCWCPADGPLSLRLTPALQVETSIESDDVGPLVKAVFEVQPPGEAMPPPLRGAGATSESAATTSLADGQVVGVVAIFEAYAEQAVLRHRA